MTIIRDEADLQRLLERGTTTEDDADQVRAFAGFLADAGRPGTKDQPATRAEVRRTRRAYFRHYGEDQGMSETMARAIVKERSAGRCELAIRGRCRGIAESAAHRQRRGQGGLWTPSNLLAACGDGASGCHGWMGQQPTWAKAAGLEVPSWANPALVPAYVEWHGSTRGWWHLTDDGCLTACTVLELAPLGEDRCDERRLLTGPVERDRPGHAGGDPARGPDEASRCDGRCVATLVRA